MGANRRSQLIDMIHFKEVELAQEEFHYRELPEKRQRALVGIGINVVFIVAGIVLGVIMSKGAFPLVPLIIWIFDIFAILYLIKLILKEIIYIGTANFNSLMSESLNRQNKMKQEMKDMEEELSQVQIKRW